jgi:lysophospholipase L1-like esterase
MANFRMVVLGDSVPWGQGLNTPEKFYYLVQAALTGSADLESCIVLAHSGATIGVNITTTGPQIDGEVPTSYPTVMQQCESFTDSPESVDLVLVNGGINDIDFRMILNPFTDSSDLHDMIRQFCFRDMKTLLRRVINKFTKPDGKIVVTGYYSMLSAESALPLAPAFLAMHGVSIAPFFDSLGGNLMDKIIANCEQFYKESSKMFKKAVSKINEVAGGTPRIFFAQPPFTASNAALAPNAWLWGVNPDFSPQDPVQNARHAACNLFEKDIIRRLSCYRASAGHPNITGSIKYAEAILAAIK